VTDEIGWLVRGLIIGIAVAAPIGPVNVLCMHRTLAFGRLNGFTSGLGAAAADATFGLIAAFGVTVVADFLIGQQYWLRLGGGAFLLGLGIRIYLAKPAAPVTTTDQRGLGWAITSTYLLTITNPLTILSFVGIFAGAGLGQGDTGYLGAGIIVLGVFLGSGVWWLALSLGIGMIRHKLDERGLQWINRGSGTVIFVFGIGALVSVTALA
jgi:threonine/homoserine/homoserine lactone efflux protein